MNTDLEAYRKWVRSTIGDLRQMAYQWEQLAKSRHVDDHGQAAYKDAAYTLNDFIDRAKWINSN